MSTFHGSMTKNKDGTNRIIEKNHICFCPTSAPFWKKTADVDFKVRTRSQEQKQDLVKRQDFNRYCRRRGHEDIKRWLEADDSEVYYMKKSDRFFVLRSP